MARTIESCGDFADFFSLFNAFTTTSHVEAVKASADDYLSKGEKLRSLAKQKFERKLKNLSISSFEEGLFSIDYSINKENSFPAIGSSLYSQDMNQITDYIRKVMRKAAEPEDEIIKQMLDYINIPEKLMVSLFKVPCSQTVINYSWRKQVGDKPVWGIRIEQPFTPTLIAYGIKGKKHTDRYKNVSFKNGDNICDLAVLLTYLLIYHFIIEESLVVSNRQAASSYLHMLGVSKEREKTLEYDDYNPFAHLWLIPKEYAGCFIYNRPFFEKLGGRYEFVDATCQELKKSITEAYNEGMLVQEMPIIYFPTRYKEALSMRRRDVMDALGFIPYEHFVEKSDVSADYYQYWMFPQDQSLFREAYRTAFARTVREKHSLVQNFKEYSSLEEKVSKARSFQDLSSHPKATLKAMEESDFNEYFGFVEYDADVDLSKVKVICDQFIAFKEKYFPYINAKDNAIRFRKLGNHKASGLYYPSVKCLCVDIKSPSSLIHEFGHLIDYTYGGLSASSDDFYKICQTYESRLKKEMNENEAFKGKMQGNTKYNLSYYLTPTEIFARCYELYCVKVLKVNNSLTPGTFGLPYPQDDEFIGMVAEYFNNLQALCGVTPEAIAS